MEIIISYSKDQLKSAVHFIAANNPSFYGNHKEIKESILENMKKLATNTNLDSIATMGYLLTCECEYEGIDNDENICHIDIWVNPSLNDLTDDLYIERIVYKND